MFDDRKRDMKTPEEVTVEGEYDTPVGCFARGKEKAYMLVNFSDPVLPSGERKRR